MKRSSSSMDNLFDKRFLTADEEIELAKRKDLGDRLAHKALIEHNMKLVRSIANRFTSPQIELGDLIMEGVVGLNATIVKYDWKKGCRLSTYATYWIWREIWRYIKNDAPVIRVPENTQKDIRVLANAIDSSNGDTGDEISLAMLLGKSVDRTRTLIVARSIATVSLDQPQTDDGANRLEFLARHGTSPEETALLRINVNQAMERLRKRSPKAHRVIELQYGTNGKDPEDNLAIVGKILKISRERARQLHRDGIAILRRILEE